LVDTLPLPCASHPLSLHDALPILHQSMLGHVGGLHVGWALALSAAIWLGMLVFWVENFVMRLDGLLLMLLPAAALAALLGGIFRSEEHTSELQSRENLVCRLLLQK